MGASASKGARAAGSGIRKYPSRVPPTSHPSNDPTPSPIQPSKPAAGPTVRPPPSASATKTEAIDLDARDPDFASRLSSLGAVQPNPHYSPTSTSSFDPQRNMSSDLPSGMMNAPPQSAFPDPGDNPALRILNSRQRIQDEADYELEQIGRRGFPGRKYADAGIIQLALMRRKHGEGDAKIEQAFQFQKGRLGVLKRGILEPL